MSQDNEQKRTPIYRYRYRSSVTGKYVSEVEAQANPRETQREREVVGYVDNFDPEDDAADV